MMFCNYNLIISYFLQPVFTRDWEVMITLSISGSKGDLFGDGVFCYFLFIHFINLPGMALWYAKERNVDGPVFGSKDNFRGMGIFIDTYSNHNGPHTVCVFIYYFCKNISFFIFSTVIHTLAQW
jgi:hypothetical protein